MIAKQSGAFGPISATQPGENATVEDWLTWFWTDFLPGWTERTRDPQGAGFFDLLDKGGQPLTTRKSLLAQARLLFAFSHIALLSGNPAHHAAARIARDALPLFRKSSGLYCRAVTRNGGQSADESDQLATSYDQCFVILGLSTWDKLEPSENVTAELESCWTAIETHLVDPATNLLLEHDGLTDPAAKSAPPRAQNPHMHLYEAALQACEMTGQQVWLDRAMAVRAKGIEFFLDVDSGTITEFIASDLTVLPGRAGQRCEIGHQYEWAWLLMREVQLGGDAAMSAVAGRMLAFADRHGFAQNGVMQGAAFDAVSADANWREDRFLLWPQTEAVKAHAIRSDDAGHAEKARSLILLIFRRYFAGRAAFANQLDDGGDVLCADALSRLHYHLFLAFTEGARAGLWKGPV